MKKISAIIVTILIEAIVLYVVSTMIGWSFVELVLVGSTIIFGVSWLLGLYNNQVSNQLIAHEKGWQGVETGTIKVKVNPIMLRQIIFMIMAFLVTVIMYLPYFL